MTNESETLLAWWHIIVAAPSVFILRLVIMIIPLLVLARPFSSSRSSSNRRRDLIMSVANCFAAGVFLAACILSLVPHAQMHELQVAQMLHHNDNHSDDVHDHSVYHGKYANLSILVGFLLIILLEQFVVACEKAPIDNSGRSKRVSVNHTRRLNDHQQDLIESSPETLSSADETTILKKDNFQAVEADTKDQRDERWIHSSISHCPKSDESTMRASHGGHGHSHTAMPALSIRSLVLLIGLSMHSVLEGIAVGLQEQSGDFWRMLLAVLMHEVLCSLAYGLSLVDTAQKQQATPFSKLNFSSILFIALTIPAGMIIGHLILPSSENATPSSYIARYILEGITAGTFIYVACIEMLAFEFSHNHKCRNDVHWWQRTGLTKAFAVCVGAGLFATIGILSDAY